MALAINAAKTFWVPLNVAVSQVIGKMGTLV